MLVIGSNKLKPNHIFVGFIGHKTSLGISDVFGVYVSRIFRYILVEPF